MKKQLLVTGGAGFIGSNFCNRLTANPECLAEYQITVLDLLTYAGNKANLAPALSRGAELIIGDVRDKASMEDLFATKGFAGVIHFAAESHVDRSIANPDIFLETNVNGTVNLLHCSRKQWEKNPSFRFLQISTDEVYGSLKKEEKPFREEHNLAPNSPYSASKASADLFVRSYYKTYGLPALITRCSNNYGPLQNREKLIPLMIHNAHRGLPLPVYGNGSNIRDWIHVDDHNDGVWEVFRKGKPGEIYNLGGSSERANIEIVRTILHILKKGEDLISFVEDRLGHDFRYAIDFSKINAELGWRPRKSFEEGLEETVHHYLKSFG